MTRLSSSARGKMRGILYTQLLKNESKYNHCFVKGR